MPLAVRGFGPKGMAVTWSQCRHLPAAALSRMYWRGKRTPLSPRNLLLWPPGTGVVPGVLRIQHIGASAPTAGKQKDETENSLTRGSAPHSGPPLCQASLLEFLLLSSRSVARRRRCITSAFRGFPRSQPSVKATEQRWKARVWSHGRAYSRLLPLPGVRASKCARGPRK